MGLIQEIDFGTPASTSQKQVTLTVDGFSVTVPEGTSIMRASMEAGIKIPKLCATDMVDAFGSCRLCLVEIDGRNGTPSSCTTPVAAMTARVPVCGFLLLLLDRSGNRQRTSRQRENSNENYQQKK